MDRIKRAYGFSVFHTKKFKARSGDFKGWSDAKCMGLIQELSFLTGQRLMHGSEFRIRENLYQRYKVGLDRKARADTRYGLCFRICLIHQIGEMARRLDQHKKFSQTRLHVVMESGHKNAGDAARIFHETKKELKGASELLASITFSNKDEFDPLMVADFLAHSTYMKTEVDLDEMERGLFPIVKEKTGLTHLEYDESGIDSASERYKSEI